MARNATLCVRAFVLGAAALLASRAGTEAEPHRFSMVVVHDTTGLHVTCVAGGAWESLSQACRKDTSCQLKANAGAVLAQAAGGRAASAGAPFEVRITAVEGELSAECKTGCAWTTVAYRCRDGAPSCGARLTFDGVEGLESPPRGK